MTGVTTQRLLNWRPWGVRHRMTWSRRFFAPCRPATTPRSCGASVRASPVSHLLRSIASSFAISHVGSGLTQPDAAYLHAPMNLRRSVSAVAVVVLTAVAAPSGFAQDKIEFPQVSQHGVVKQRVGLTDIEVDYSRPNKNKREIFGGVVPWDKVWRTGANAPTRIKFSADVKFGEKDVPAGEYALYTIPKSNEWAVILS